MIKAELNQSVLKGGQRIADRDVRRALMAVSRALRVRRPVTISVGFVSEREIKRLNHAYRGKDCITDVLSFPFDNHPSPPPDRIDLAVRAGLLQKEGERKKVLPLFKGELEGVTVGEVLICYQQAKRQAKDIGHPVTDEVVFLLVHGVLHLFGYDHEKPRDSKKMFPLQEKILRTLGIEPRL